MRFGDVLTRKPSPLGKVAFAKQMTDEENTGERRVSLPWRFFGCASE